MKNNIHPRHGDTYMRECSEAPAMLLCLTPAMKEAVSKMKNWFNGITAKSSQRGSSEVTNSATENAQSLFSNDYAPPVVKKELDSIPAPEDLVITKSEHEDTLMVSWAKSPSRQLYLLQVNIENPANPSCWITHSVSTQNWLEIEDVDTERPLWVRVCALGNDGRSKWTMLGKKQQ